ncbi:hydroxyethylthiazole kinase [Irregularibacter muris]|uniref:Hydroxyethylthiazole kinase n=1 Tax=Irregularibacter muris TaxID=1796619 RepID=A0AAE3HCJ6_9FIRM|nr:hydroxyethylthiazole kinase [Irregularibacter muris]MCR1897456.1 hydroxyethylthiazole kinase [Irregularibacter muris]
MNNLMNACTDLLHEIKGKNPLIHNITNYVTVNDCANAVLAIGASPIMADDAAEVEEIVSISSALVINIGTLNQHTIDSMIMAGKKANELNIPVVFDPVGAGASTLRNQTTQEILRQVKIDVIRGNLSEISFIAGFKSSTKGVDTSMVDEKNDAVGIAKLVCHRYSCVVGITGKVDIISDGIKVAKIANGHKLLSKVTGTGCMTSALVGSFCGVTKDYYTATAAGIAAMGIAGEIAFEKVGVMGTGSFHISVIDALSNMNSTLLLEREKIDETKY